MARGVVTTQKRALTKQYVRHRLRDADAKMELTSEYGLCLGARLRTP